MAITRHGNKRDASLLAGSSGKKTKTIWPTLVGPWAGQCWRLGSRWLAVFGLGQLLVACGRPPAPSDFKHGCVLDSKDPLKRFKRSKVQVIFVGNG